MSDTQSAAVPAASLRLLLRRGALAVPLLGESERRALLASTRALAWRPATPEVGPAHRRVYQDFELCYDVPAGHALWGLAQSVERGLGESMRELAPAEADAFELNDLIVQRYPPGCRGITAHRDHLRYRLLVALVLLEGDGCFCVCDDRDGAGEREIPFRPGEMLLMRAPGLGPSRQRPYHLMRGVTRTRVTVGLRYDSRIRPG